MKSYNNCDDFADDYCKEVVGNIKNYMEKNNISRGSLAEKSGLGQSTISKLFSGEMRATLILIAKICKALEVDPGEFLTLDRKSIKESVGGTVVLAESAGTLISNPSHPAFNGYLRTFNVYFNSTISSENNILKGTLKLEATGDGEQCKAEMLLDTGKRKSDGMPYTKYYTGMVIISLSMSACYCTLVEKTIGEVCFLVFNHMFLFHEDLICRMANVATVSSGGSKRPTVHRLLISRKELDVDNEQSEDFKFLRGQLMLNTSEIYIKKKALEKMKANESELFANEKMKELMDEFQTNWEKDEVYVIDEAILRKAVCPKTEKVKFISLLRQYSVSAKYNKISTKTDEHIYDYLESKL